jgi:hypothetical protein
MSDRDTYYDYTFRVYPQSVSPYTNGVRTCFDMYGYLTMIFTEPEFEKFRAELWVDGFDVHEITRRVSTPDEVIQ